MCVVVKIVQYVASTQFQASFIMFQKYSDKRVGATYLTVLASVRNFFNITINNLTLRGILRFGFKNTFAAITVFNAFSFLVVRNWYLDYLENLDNKDYQLENLRVSKVKDKEE